MPSKRKVSNLLALAVLSYLSQQPMHPYELGRNLREHGDDRSIKYNHGSLYMVVGQLARAGFITEQETGRAGQRPERTVYALTDTGRAELRDWLRELVGEPEPEFTAFEAALSVVGILPPDEVIALLGKRADTIEANLAEHRTRLREVMKAVPRLLLIEIEYKLAIAEAEARWVRSLVTELTDGTMPDMHLWHEFQARLRKEPEK